MPARWANTFERIGERVSRLSVVSVAVGAVFVSVLADGLGSSPAFGVFLSMARNPGSDPGITGTDSFVLGSPAGSLLAALFGATSPSTFILFNLGLVVSTYAFTIWVVNRRFGPKAAKTTALLWAVLPISSVLLIWLGQPDPLTYAAATALAIVSSPIAAGLWGLVGGFTHQLQLALILAVLVIWRQVSWKWVTFATLGVILGGFLVGVWHTVAHITQEFDRIEYFAEFGPWHILRTAASAWQPILFSLFAGAWPLVIRLLDKRLALIIITFALVAFFTFDNTRVFALLSWPIVFLLGLEVDDEKTIGWLTLAALTIPPVVVWQGIILHPSWG